MSFGGKGYVSCMGEILIDMVQESKEDKLFKAHPGGAPANVAVGISRLGGKSAFMGKVGKDGLGDFLIETLKKDNVSVNSLKQEGKTGMALVSLDDKGERSFDFYEKLISYCEMDVNTEVLDESSIFHFGSISLIDKPQACATVKCLKAAQERNVLISYDPNLRMNLWECSSSAAEGMTVGLKFAQVLKIADNEIEFLTGEKDIPKGIEKLLEINPDLKLIAVTRGENGSYCWYQGKGKAIPTFKADVVDTTGAGDGFVAGLLFSIQKNGGLESMDWDKVEKAFKLANTVGTITTMKKGAISALPTIKDVEKYM